MTLLHPSKIEENFIFRVLWEFFSNAFFTMFVFGSALILVSQSSGLNSSPLFAGLLTGSLCQIFINQTGIPYAKFIGGLTPPIICSIVILLLGYEQQVLLEFLLIFILYSFSNSLLQEPLNDDRLSPNIILYLFLQLFRILTVFFLAGFLHKSIPDIHVKMIDSVNFMTIDFSLDKMSLFIFLSFAVTVLSLIVSSIQLIMLKNELLLLSRKLKNISSWSFDQKVIEDKMLNGDTGIVESSKIVLIGDIRGFTKFTENSNLSHVMSVLNKYYTEIEMCIHQTDGFKPEFIADEFVTFFDTIENALECAFLIRERLPGLLKKSKLNLGMGITKGNVLEGLIGGNQSKKYTLVGKAINLAARLQQHATDGQILCSKEVIASLSKDIIYKEIRGLHLKGVKNDQIFYEIINFVEHEDTAPRSFRENLKSRANQFWGNIKDLYKGLFNPDHSESHKLQNN
ncbi:hypothetical protein GF357_02125 [Candidatus Dojkabacteria bacterium]|nr:hypothetical protein [Candidatus Dojkabacteria bacterium]